MRPNPRPLVMRFGAFGDLVLLLPLIRALSVRFGHPVDIVSSGDWAAPLLTGQLGVGQLFLIRSRRRPYLISPDQWRLVAALRRRGVGPTWFLDPQNVGLDLLHRAAIDADWIVNANDVPDVPGEHCLERWNRLAACDPLALATATRPVMAVTGCSLNVPAGPNDELELLLASRNLNNRRLLLVQAGNKRTMRRGDRRRASNNKYWPETHWRQVIRALHARHPQHAIVLLGVAAEYELNEDILAGLDPGDVQSAFNLAGELPVPLLLALMQRADAMVTVDTGPAHAAAALGLPLLVLFSAADPRHYRPWGAGESPVLVLRCDDGATLETLSVEPVLEALARLPLRAGPPYS